MYAIVTDGVPVAASNNAVVNHVKTITERQHPISAIKAWPKADREALGVYEISKQAVDVLPYQDVTDGGLVFADGIVTLQRTVADWSSERVEAEKTLLKDRIDSEALSERQKYVSTIWGQETVYLEKEAEARLFDAWDGQGDAPATPYLTAEASVTGVQFSDLITAVLTNGAQWRGVSILIETNRMRLKTLIGEAETASDLRDLDLSWSA